MAMDFAKTLVQLQGHIRDMPTRLTQVLMDVERGDISIETRNLIPRISYERSVQQYFAFPRFVCINHYVRSFLFRSMVTGTTLHSPFRYRWSGIMRNRIIDFWCLGMHVLFARYLSIRFYEKQIVRILRFFMYAAESDR